MAILVSDVYSLARTRAGDSTTTPEWMTDAVILPAVNEAYRFCARLLRAQGMGLLRKISAAIAVTSGGGSVSRGVAATDFPADALRPIYIQERKTTPPGPWQKITMATEGFFTEDVSTAFELWDWRNDIIYLKPASQANDIRIAYEAELAALTTTTSPVLIPDSLDPMAKLLASYMLKSRDEANYAKDLEEAAIKDLMLIAESEKRAKLARGGTWSA